MVGNETIHELKTQLIKVFTQTIAEYDVMNCYEIILKQLCQQYPTDVSERYYDGSQHCSYELYIEADIISFQFGTIVTALLFFFFYKAHQDHHVTQSCLLHSPFVF